MDTINRLPAGSLLLSFLPVLLLFASGCDLRYDDSEDSASQAWPGANPAQPPPGDMGGASQSGAALHRNEIEAIEKILYRMSPAEMWDADGVGRSLLRLHEAVTEQDPSSTAASDLLFFSTEVGARADTGYSVLDLGWARKEWERIRGDLFGSEPWFKKSTKELEAAQKPPEPKVDPAQIR